MKLSPIQRAVRNYGTQAALAKVLGVQPAAVSQWVTRHRPVPAKHCISIERASGVSRHELRPDVFGRANVA